MESVSAPTLQSVMLPGPSGPLEAIVRRPVRVKGAAVVAHPHPLHGGTMHTKVVHRAAKMLCERFGLVSLRFNFRGVGASAGVFDDGPGEVQDLLAAAAWIREREPAGLFVLGGFSFGSIAALRAASVLRPSALLLIGVPVDRYPSDAGSLAGIPGVWVAGDRDAFSPVPAARELAEAHGWRLEIVEGADHFFTGCLDAFEKQAGDALAEVLAR